MTNEPLSWSFCVAINHQPNYVSRMKYCKSKITNKFMQMYGNLKVILELSVTETICPYS